MLTRFLTLLSVGLLASMQARAQSLMPTDMAGTVDLPSRMHVSGGGWAQIYNLPELQSFGIDVVLTLALAALLTFHPVRRASRTRPRDFVMPRLFLLYALVGMAVGFLVIQHGYIIGFVIFGIGALLRFRSNLDDPVDTVEMIVVTVLGLCVGLNLPIMGILIGAVTWIVIWLTGKRLPLEIRLQAEDAAQLDKQLADLKGIVGEEGWKVVHQHRATSKFSIRLVVLVPVSQGLEGAEDTLASGLPKAGATWKVST